MPKYQMIVPTATDAKAANRKNFSLSNSERLQKLFKSSLPVLGEEADYKTKWLGQLLSGIVEGNDQVGRFDLNFSTTDETATMGPPKMSGVPVGAAGLPATPYLPNPASPGEEGGADPNKLPDVAGNVMQIPTSLSPVPVNDPSRSPDMISKNMATRTVGSYMPGRSNATVASGKS